jgi:rhodanese-related sulfurtransferase
VTDGAPAPGEGDPAGPEVAPAGSRIDRRLAEVRATLDRVAPDDLAREVAAGAVVVDLRPESDRSAEGELPGAIAIERIHLEWRFDRTSGAALPGVDDETRVILFCNDGYASSLAAADLRGLGIHRATDLAGGYRAWRRSTGTT